MNVTLKFNVLFLDFKQVFHSVKKKVEQSRYRPGVAQRVPGSLFSQIS